MRPTFFGPFRRFGVLSLAAAALAVPCSAQSGSGAASRALNALRATPERRVAANPDLTTRVQLGGHLPLWVRAENAAAATVPVSAPLQVTVVLKRDAATQAAFETLLAEQQTPGSALYHQWLTPAQVGSMFGVAPADLQAVESWLQQEGLTVTRVEPNGVLLDVTGSVTAVSNAFRTNFAEYRVGAETRLSATSEPSVPAALQAVIAGVHGMSQSSLHPQSIATAVQGKLTAQVAGGGLTAKPMLTATNGQHFLTPNDFATIYDVSSVYSGGNTGATVAGKAQHVAIIGRSRVAATDISQFESLTGLPTAQPNVIIPTGGIDPGTTNGGDQDEATLDVDRVMGTAPGAGVDLVVSADSNTVSGIYTAAAYEVNTLVDPVMSISFGDCEADAGQQGVSVWNTLFSAAAAEGISVMVSSGDSGAAGCDGNSSKLPVTQTASINYICSSSYATCVGGTEFADTSDASNYWSAQNGSGESSAVSYIPEGAWNEPTQAGSTNQLTYVAAATGGGASAYIAKPSWQTGAGVPADGMRDVPDVALSSATHDGYLACLAYAGGDCSKNEFEVFGGTSAAAPGMAGIVALMNSATGVAAGNVNPLLYRLAASTPSAFHDVTETTAGVSGCTVSIPSMCNNSTPSSAGLTGGLAGFEVGAGFDESTGWGSVDAAKLIAASMPTGGSAAGTSSSSGSFSMGSTPTSVSVTAGATSGNTLTVFATAANGFTGVVQMSCSIAAQGTATLLPSCVVSPATVTLSTAAPSGSAVVTISSQAASATSSTCGGTGGSPTTAVKLGGLAFAGLCVLLLPASKRRDVRGLLMVVAAAAGMSVMTGCGGGAAAAVGTSPSCAAQGTSGTTAGSYVVTVTGKSGSTTASTTFALTVH
ncbi:MAG TPA: S53 family peptidase [Acidobacteriaceae bacterium]|nr:S53 family peptidase [Acidobacteriaceae bacterium]